MKELNLFNKKKYSISLVAITDCGKVRKNNQDNVIVNQRILMKDKKGFSAAKGGSSLTKYICFAGVFDGMGGLVNGERASYIAAEETRRTFEAELKYETSVEKMLEMICKNANQTVCEEVKKTRDKMGTTASMLYFYKENVWICNIGDSPIYRLRDGRLEEIFEEHTDRKFRMEMLGKESVKGKKFPLTQYIGMPQEEMEISPYIKKDEIMKGDTYLICSDGLTDMVSEEEIRDVLNFGQTLEEKVKYLRDRAIECGGKDNISIICAEIL